MYSWSKDFPTLTELFFGKGINPATDKPYVKAVPKEKGKKELTTKQQTN
jgi:hypothetical protein